MLRVFCAVIPVLIIILHLVFDQTILWILTLLFGILGLMFASVNFRFRKDRLSVILLAGNVITFLYCVIITIIEFTG
ncbi:hypothetical protein [Corticicoccus populi]|uniref:Uncharacterized protein n=1 Tax=Corticicoccus populi TaxID=1812821 RepID=A0ABW5WYX5_9STAP